MNAEELKVRTKDFAKRVIHLCRVLRKSEEGRPIANPLFRSGTSVGANDRATCRARSKRDFRSKLGIVLEEADESLYWLELVHELSIVKPTLLESLMDEARQLVAIFVASLNTAQGNEVRI